MLLLSKEIIFLLQFSQACLSDNNDSCDHVDCCIAMFVETCEFILSVFFKYCTLVAFIYIVQLNKLLVQTQSKINKMNCELMLTYDTPALRQTGSRNLMDHNMGYLYETCDQISDFCHQ